MSSNARRCLVIVLAAGEGVRMRSNRPKALHEIAGRAMLAHVLHLAVLHLDELGLLVGRQHRLDLIVGALADALGLGPFVLLRHGRVLVHAHHLLLFLIQHRFDLRLLVGSEVERLGQVRQALVG